uniref:AlNc14C111G6420 protein n=1 Tax=Albugo laibachii Nc14 TaxID=890382 RepID=F0WIL9_9STRA|nr:AlNc14C111G6420 [Albugo laibachii Nc14]|eukprot:CCA21104.1 AlNc14C111G6420 [Albugo laibachii Nc14]
MKRVGGGYVLQAPRVERNQQQHRGARPTPPIPADTRRTTLATIPAREVASQQRPATIQVDRVTPPTSTVATRYNSAARTASAVASQPILATIQVDRITPPTSTVATRTNSAARIAPAVASQPIPATIQVDRITPPTTTVARTTASVTPAVRLVIIEPPRTVSSDLSRLKEENEALSAFLADKSVQLRDALEREVRITTQVEDVKNKLQTSLKKNEEYQHRLDDALVTHVQDQRKIKIAMEGQEQLKADVAASRKMLEGFKTFMVEQGKQLEALQLARDHPPRPTQTTQTSEVDKNRIKIHGVHEIEDFYRAHWEKD